MEEAYLEVRRNGGADLVRLAGEQLTLGRAPGNTVSFPSDDTVSRHHAVLELVSGGWSLRDIGSSNGTYVNGNKLEKERILQPDDEIALGQNRIVFRVGRVDARTGRIPADREQSQPLSPSPPGYLDISEEWVADPAQRRTAPPPVRDDARNAVEAHKPSPAPSAAPGISPERTTSKGSDRGARRRQRGRGHVRGLARGIQTRTSETERSILAFRVDSYDSSGNRLNPVAVELRGHDAGQISEGEEVEVTGKWSHGTLRAKKVINLSTNAEIRGPSTGTKVAFICVLVLIACFFAFVVYSIVTAPDVSNPFEEGRHAPTIPVGLRS